MISLLERVSFDTTSELRFPTPALALLAIVGIGMLAKTEGAPIREPDGIFYGAITNSSNGMLLVSGSVRWSASGSGSIANVESTIANVNGQSFYIARIPFETRSAGNLTFTPTPNTLPLTPTPATFTRSATVNNVAATPEPPASTNFTFSKSNRGRIERVDLTVNLPTDPNLDSDGDSVPDWAERIAGTDPNDQNSLFNASADIEPAPGSGLVIKWSSVAGKTYSIYRTTDLNQPFTAIRTGIDATLPNNRFTDSTATGPGPFFYRIRVE